MFEMNPNTEIVFNEKNEKIDYVEKKTCEFCKMNFLDIKKLGVIGCANCYKTFKKEFIDIIEKKQGAVEHIGKTPSKHLSKLMLQDKLKELEIKKQQAIEDEDFILAESLKNQIEKVKGDILDGRL